MKIGTVIEGMTLFEVADALRFCPDAHPDVWHKRTAELRSQGRNDEAKIVEAEFSEYMSEAARVAADRTMGMVASWANAVVENDESLETS